MSLKEPKKMGNLTNKRSFVHAANKKREGEQDLMSKAKVARILKTHFGLSAIYHDLFVGIHKRDSYWLQHLTRAQLDSNDFWPHKPDLIVTNSRHPLFFEIDGEHHFFTMRGIIQTKDRNDHYDLAGIWHVSLLRSEIQYTEPQLTAIIAKKLERYDLRLKDNEHIYIL